MLFFGLAYSQDSNQFQKVLQKAEISLKKAEVDNALTTSKEALSIAFAFKDHLLKAKAFNTIGLCFDKSSETEGASFFYQKGLDEAILTNNDSIKGFLYANLGLVYQNTNASKSENYFKKSLLFFKKINKSDSISNQILSNYKTTYLNIPKTESKVDLSNYRKQIESIENQTEKPLIDFRDSKTIDILSAIIIGTLLLLVFSLLRNNKLREASNKILEANNKELLLAKNKAEKATLLKSQFVTTITHELRTPLYGVVGITDIILDEHKELANSSHINSLKFSANYLLSLVNDLLQINKIEEQKVVLENSDFNLLEELTTIVNSLQFIAIKNANKVTIDIDQKIPTILFGDKLRLTQIFINLISNALKFTKDGEVKIMASLLKTEKKYCFITFSVSDTGIGISKEDQVEVFEKFVQIERNEDDYQGTGLGLTIVKNLVEIFGGKIEIHSTEKQGAKFFFTIPLMVSENQKSEPKSKQLDTESKSNIYNILVVEDNKINQIVTRKILEKNNFKCKVVDDGYIVTEVLQSEKFDIILMDINMPILNGFETTKLIRSQGFKIPIVALTAFDREEISGQAFASGMNDIIIKPFDKAKLFQIISDMIATKN